MRSRMADREVRRDDLDRSGGLVLQLVERVDLGLDLVEMRADPFQKPLADAVGATARMVRVSKRMPSRVSSWRMMWLSGDCDMPNLAAALVKLPSRATARKASRSLTFWRVIYEPSSWAKADHSNIRRRFERRRGGAEPSPRKGPYSSRSILTVTRPGRSKIETSPSICPSTTMPGEGTRPPALDADAIRRTMR